MLEIRKGQIEAFESDAVRRKIEEMCGVLPGMYPGLCLALGDAGVRRWASKGLEKARSYGMRKVETSMRYIHLMFMLLDEDFDANPKTPWAAAILGWKNAAEGLKIAALEKRARVEIERRP